MCWPFLDWCTRPIGFDLEVGSEAVASVAKIDPGEWSLLATGAQNLCKRIDTAPEHLPRTCVFRCPYWLSLLLAPSIDVVQPGVVAHCACSSNTDSHERPGARMLFFFYYYAFFFFLPLPICRQVARDNSVVIARSPSSIRSG
mmetsp:Transcript_57208/g.121642  ORF Transcript_57208/g.121642 Transcript_57208/m.121642 type:complete len:143 (+) Transcript_57208:238-666(+)